MKNSVMLLRKLGFKMMPAPLDYAVDSIEGVAIYHRDDSAISFTLKSLTNSFTPGLFQFVCASCATLGKGSAKLNVDEGAIAGLLDAINNSELKKAITAMKYTQVAAKIEFDYDQLSQSE